MFHCDSECICEKTNSKNEGKVTETLYHQKDFSLSYYFKSDIKLVLPSGGCQPFGNVCKV